jgi:hypothetical protein
MREPKPRPEGRANECKVNVQILSTSCCYFSWYFTLIEKHQNLVTPVIPTKMERAAKNEDPHSPTVVAMRVWRPFLVENAGQR